MFETAEVTAAKHQIKGPAMGLLVTGVLGIVSQVFGLLYNLVTGAMLGGDLAESLGAMAIVGSLGIITSLIPIILSGVVVFGALQMRDAKNYPMAMAAAIIACIPCCGPCCLAIPVGIWALVVLNKPEVKAAFAA